MTTFYQQFFFPPLCMVSHQCSPDCVDVTQGPHISYTDLWLIGVVTGCCLLVLKKKKKTWKKTLPTLQRLSLNTDKHTLFWVINHVLKTDWYWMQPGLYSHWSIDLTTRNNTKLHWNLKVHNINRFPQGQNKRVNNKSNLNLIRRIAHSWTYKVKIW